MRGLGGVVLAIVVLAVSGCATGPMTPPAVNVSGNWVGTWQYEFVQQGSGDLRGSFQQDGAKLTGNFNITGPVVNHVANVTGVVSGNDVLLTAPSSGRLTVSGNTITGTVNGLVPAKLTLRKQ